MRQIHHRLQQSHGDRAGPAAATDQRQRGPATTFQRMRRRSPPRSRPQPAAPTPSPAPTAPRAAKATRSPRAVTQARAEAVRDDCARTGQPLTTAVLADRLGISPGYARRLLRDLNDTHHAATTDRRRGRRPPGGRAAGGAAMTTPPSTPPPGEHATGSTPPPPAGRPPRHRLHQRPARRRTILIRLDDAGVREGRRGCPAGRAHPGRVRRDRRRPHRARHRPRRRHHLAGSPPRADPSQNPDPPLRRQRQPDRRRPQRRRRRTAVDPARHPHHHRRRPPPRHRRRSAHAPTHLTRRRTTMTTTDHGPAPAPAQRIRRRAGRLGRLRRAGRRSHRRLPPHRRPHHDHPLRPSLGHPRRPPRRGLHHRDRLPPVAQRPPRPHRYSCHTPLCQRARPPASRPGHPVQRPSTGLTSGWLIRNSSVVRRPVQGT